MINSVQKNTFIHFITIFFLVLIAYMNAINNDFVSDDLGLFNNPERMGKFTYIWGEPQSIAKTTTNFIIFSLFGPNPAAFRLTTILLHTGVCFCIYLIVKSLTKNQTAAFLSGMVSAVHPILVEAVTWISAGNYVQYSFLYLLSLYLYPKQANNNRNYIFSIFFFILSIMTSEKALPLCLTFPLYDIAFGNFAKNWRRSLPYFFASGIWLVFIFVIIKYPQFRASNLVTSYYSDSGLYNPLIQIPTAITSYLELLFWPQNLSFYHSEFAMNYISFGYKVAGLIMFMVLTVYSFFRFKFGFFFMSLFIISLLVTLTPLKIAWIVAERYAYLGSVGLIAILSYVTVKFISLAKKIRIPIYICLTVLLIALISRTMIRNGDWKTADNLWLATGKTAPSDPKTHNNLGDYYGRHGDLDRAINEFTLAIKLQQNYADAYHNRGNTYVQLKNYEKAADDYQTALKYNPRIWQSHQNLAAIYFNNGQYDKSLQHMQDALKINDNPNLKINLAIVYLKLGDKNSAKKAVKLALTQDPQIKLPNELSALTEN